MRHPERWLAVLRIVVGAWFLKSLFTKLTVVMAWGVVPVPAASDRWIATMPRLIERYAAENPFPAYKAFLLETIAPNPAFAHLTGEVTKLPVPGFISGPGSFGTRFGNGFIQEGQSPSVIQAVNACANTLLNVPSRTLTFPNSVRIGFSNGRMVFSASWNIGIATA